MISLHLIFVVNRTKGTSARKDNLIVTLTFQFALKIIALVEILEGSGKYAIGINLFGQEPL
jgi:hypothetical protein